MLTRALKNSLWVIVEYLSGPLLILLTTPIFLAHLGSKDFGIWMLLNAVAAISTVMNAGLISATVKRVSGATTGATDDQLAPIVSGALGLAVGGACLSLLIVIGVSALSANAVLPIGEAGATFALYVAATVSLLFIDQIDAVFTAVLKGQEHFSRSTKIEISTRVFTFGLVWIFIEAGFGLQGVFIAVIIGGLARVGARSLATRKLVPKWSFFPDFTQARSMLPMASWGWIAGAGSASYTIVDRFIISSQMGASALAHYTIASQLATQIHAVLGAGFSILFPMIGRLTASRAGARIEKITVIATAITWVAASLFAGTLIYFGNEILTLWVGPAAAAQSMPALVLLSIAAWVQGLSIAPHFVLLGLGKFKAIALFGVAAGAASSCMMYILAANHGIEGVGSGRIVYGVVLLGYFFFLVRASSSTKAAGR